MIIQGVFQATRQGETLMGDYQSAKVVEFFFMATDRSCAASVSAYVTGSNLDSSIAHLRVPLRQL